MATRLSTHMTVTLDMARARRDNLLAESTRAVEIVRRLEEMAPDVDERFGNKDSLLVQEHNELLRLLKQCGI